jgi:hypothetical protein
VVDDGWLNVALLMVTVRLGGMSAEPEETMALVT